MTDNTSIPSDEQAQAMRQALARYEQQKAYEAALKRQALYEQIAPIVNCEEFIHVFEQIKTVRENGPTDDMFFGIGVDAIYNGMLNLGIQCANWQAPVDPNAPVAPAPNPEGTSDGE